MKQPIEEVLISFMPTRKLNWFYEEFFRIKNALVENDAQFFFFIFCYSMDILFSYLFSFTLFMLSLLQSSETIESYSNQLLTHKARILFAFC